MIKKNLFLLLSLIFSALFFIGSMSAAKAATFDFSPSSASLIQVCNNTLTINIDATGQSSNAADIEVHYDPSKINILNSDNSFPGTHIKQGNAYESYFANQVDSNTGIIRLAGASFSNPLSTKKVFASIDFNTKPGVTNTQFIIYYTGDTLHSNIADATTSTNILTSVTNGSYTFSPGVCYKDTSPPQVQFITPTNYATNVALNTSVAISISDDLSGIDLNSLKFDIGGVIYTSTSPQLSYTGTNLKYNFIIKPINSFIANQATTIIVTGADNTGNKFNQQIVFNIPPSTPPPPFICPGSYPTSYSVNDLTGTIHTFTSQTCNNISDLFTGNNNVGILKSTFLSGSFIDKFFNSIGANGLGALAAGIVFSFELLPLLALLNLPVLFFNTILVILGIKKRKPWGFVTDGVTNKPISFANCKLYLAGTVSLLSQTVSDLDGKYGFAIGPGAYRIEVSQVGYQNFIKDIIINEGELSYVYDVNLKPLKYLNINNQRKGLNYFRLLILDLYRKFRIFIFGIGFALSILSIITSFNILNLLVFLFYLLIIVGYIIIKVRHPNPYASVVDSETELRIPNVIIKIFDLKTWNLVDTQMTNSNGQFDFWGEPGEYGVLVALRNYKFPSIKNSYDLIPEKYNSLIRIKLAKGNNKLVLYVDPQNDRASVLGTINPEPSTRNISSGNLQSPFN